MDLIFLSSILPLGQLEGTPPAPAPTSLTEGAEKIFETGRITADAVSASFDPLWNNILAGGLYKAIADIGVAVAVFSLGLFLVQWANQMMNGDGDKAFTELIWPVIVIVFLSNDGALLSTGILELRAIGNQINTTMLNSAVANESLQQEYQQTRIGSAIDDMLAANIADCADSSQGRAGRQRSACIAAAKTEANQQRLRYGLIQPEESSWWFGGIVQWYVRNILWALHSAFQWAVEIVLLITALLAPLAMGLSLLPTPGKPIVSWVSGFVGVYLMKLNFNLIAGIAAYAVSLSNAISTTLVLPILLGIFAPILAVLIGLQGGSTLFNALSSAAIFVTYRGVLNFGVGAIKGGFRRGTRSLRRR